MNVYDTIRERENKNLPGPVNYAPNGLLILPPPGLILQQLNQTIAAATVVSVPAKPEPTSSSSSQTR